MSKTPSAGANVASLLTAFLRVNPAPKLEFPPRPDGKIIWLHIPEDTPSGPIQELCKMLCQRFEQHICLITSPAENAIPASDLITLSAVPAENNADIDTFLGHWQPDILLWADANLHPKLLQRFNASKKPMFMFNMPELNFARRGLRRIQALSVALFKAAQVTNPEALARLVSLGFRRENIDQVPTITEIARPLPDNESRRRDMAKLLGQRPVWCAAKMQRSECAKIADAHHQARKSFPTAALVIVPENPNDADDIAKSLATEGWKVATDLDDPAQERLSEIVVITRKSDLGIWLRLSAVTVLGGTFDGPAACDPFLATALGSAAICGPVRSPFAEKFRQLERGDGIVMLDDIKDLASMLTATLAPDRAAELATNAWAIGSDSVDPLIKIIDMITPSLTETP